MYCKVLNVLIIYRIMCFLLFLIWFSDCGWKTDQNSVSSSFKTLHLLPSHISVPVSKTSWNIFIVLWRKLKKKVSYQKWKSNLLLAIYWKIIFFDITCNILKTAQSRSSFELAYLMTYYVAETFTIKTLDR